MISIVIVSYNTSRLLEGCLGSIATHCPDAEVVVVDNASRDDSAAMVRERFPAVRLVALPENLGFAGANNAGLGVTTGEFVVLLNSDTLLEDDSLQRCALWMRANPRLGAVSPGLIGFDDRPQQCFYEFPRVLTSLQVARRFIPHRVPGDSDPSSWLAGTALMIRRSALEGLGGTLDDGYFMYWEDADVSYRLRAAGWQLARYPEAHVRHLGGASGGGADENRRGDLYAWYVYGKHRWFALHRPAWEAAGVWAFEWVNVVHKLLRGAVRRRSRFECRQALIIAGVLGRRLVGLAPPRPGGRPAVSTPGPGSG